MPKSHRDFDLPTLFAVATLASVAGLLGWMALRSDDESARDAAAETEVRDFIRELERDLLRNPHIELFVHISPDRGAVDERADAVRHSLAQIRTIEKLRFTDVQISIVGAKALAQFIARGYLADAAGHLNPHTQPVLLRLERYTDGWKITDVDPRPEIH